MRATVYTEAGGWGLPTFDADGLAALALLRFANIPFTISSGASPSLTAADTLPVVVFDKGHPSSPSSQQQQQPSVCAGLPSLVALLTADLDLPDPNHHLTPFMVAEATAFTALVASRFAPARQHELFVDDRNYHHIYEALIEHQYAHLAFPLNRLLPFLRRRQIRQALQLATNTALTPTTAATADATAPPSNTNASSNSPNSTPTPPPTSPSPSPSPSLSPSSSSSAAAAAASSSLQALQFNAGIALTALSTRLGERSKYFYGDQPSVLDAVVFGHLASVLFIPLPRSILRAQLAAFPNLVAFVNRIKATYFATDADGARIVGELDLDELDRQRRDAADRAAAAVGDPDAARKAKETPEEATRRRWNNYFVWGSVAAFAVHVLLGNEIELDLE